MRTHACLLAVAAFASVAAAQYSVNWYTIDGGGGTSTGGGYTISGTIGQPDAGPAMTGSTYTVTGGFWVGTGTGGTGCSACAADYDGNGGVDGGDLAAFFADFEAGEGCADVDLNGGVDGGDLAYFFAVFEAGGC